MKVEYLIIRLNTLRILSLWCNNFKNNQKIRAASHNSNTKTVKVEFIVDLFLLLSNLILILVENENKFFKYLCKNFIFDFYKKQDKIFLLTILSWFLKGNKDKIVCPF